MADIEVFTGETLLDELKKVEEVGLLFVKGYNYSEISTLLSLPIDKTKSHVKEYKKILNRQAEDDPYFLEKLQFNTIKALQ